MVRINNVETSTNLIYRPEPHMIMSTDASKVCWGFVIVLKLEGFGLRRRVINYYINYLEVLAVYFGLKAHKNLVSKMHVKVLVDNTRLS